MSATFAPFSPLKGSLAILKTTFSGMGGACLLCRRLLSSCSSFRRAEWLCLSASISFLRALSSSLDWLKAGYVWNRVSTIPARTILSTLFVMASYDMALYDTLTTTSPSSRVGRRQSSSPCRCGTGHATRPMFPAASVAVITASPGPTRKRLIPGPRSSSSSSLATNRIPGLAVRVILMISPSASTFPPSVIVYALQMSLADTWKSPRLSFSFSSSRSLSRGDFFIRGTGTQYTVGGVVSLTVTLEVQEFEFPEPSVALQEMLVVASGRVDPDAGQFVEGIPQLSLAAALKVAVAPPGPVHSTI